MEKHQFKFPHSPLKIFSFLFVSAIFVGVAVLLIASAKGFKLEQKGFNFGLKKTGTLIITSQPAGAKIYINGKLSKKNTGSNLFSTKINNLFKGKHNLRIEKEGYIPWSKEIEIEEEAVTWANYIKLFPNEIKEEEVISENVLLAKQSNDNRKIALALENKEKNLELYVLDSLTLNKTKIYPTEKSEVKITTISDLDWSFDNSKILIHTAIDEKLNYLLINSKENSEITNITNLFKFDFKKIVFNPHESKELFGLKEGNLYKINTQDKTISATLLEGIISFEIAQDRSIYGAKETLSGVSLWKSDLSGNNSKAVIKSLPKSEHYKIQYSGSNTNRIAVLVNGAVKTAYLADKLENTIELTQLTQEVTSVAWSPNGKRIMLRNDKNIWVYDLEKEKSFDTVKDKEIRHARWDEGNDHLALNIGGEFSLIEFDGKNNIKIGESNKNEVYFSPENRNYLRIQRDKNGINKLINYRR